MRVKNAFRVVAGYFWKSHWARNYHVTEHQSVMNSRDNNSDSESGVQQLVTATDRCVTAIIEANDSSTLVSAKDDARKSSLTENAEDFLSTNEQQSEAPQPHSKVNHLTVEINHRNVIRRIQEILSSPDSLSLSNRYIGISLSGCGFLGSYHFGVSICFKRNAKDLLSKITHYGGSSVGSLLAALLILAPDSLEESVNELYKFADEINALPLGALTPGFYLAERLAKLTEKFLPMDISGVDNHLLISVTKQADYTNRIISRYSSREYLTHALMASCYIPIYSMGYFANAPELDGERCIDGGYTNNLPMFQNIPTITISPFSGSAIISPTDRNLFDWKMRLGNQIMKVNLQNVVRGAQALFPPSSTVLRAYYEMGYRDAMKFLMDNGFYEREEGTPL